MRKCFLVGVLMLCIARLAAAGPTTQPSALDQRVGDLKVSKAPLADVVDALRDTGAKSIDVNWTALATAGIDKETLVTLDLTEPTVAQVIKAISAGLEGDKKDVIACIDEEGTVYISTREDVKTRRVSEPIPTRGDAIAAAKTTEALGRVLPEVNFNSIGAGDVVEFLANITQLKIDANWDALEAAGARKDTAVTLRIRNHTVKRVLRLLLDDIGGSTGAKLDYVVDGDHVLISTRDDLLKK
ncbi:hypothetical protein BH09PLA1_BH09PLA1_04080 [soil metagenome]